MPLTVAIDLDEVLGFFVKPLCAFHNECYGSKLEVSDFSSYRFCKVWGGTDAEAIEKVHKFFKSRHFDDIPLVPGAQYAVRELSVKGYDLVVVTSRQYVIEEHTRHWVNTHFPGVFREVVFGNHWGREGKKLTKKELCRKLGASVLIDDNLAYVSEAANAGIKAILFDLDGSYPWNKPKNGTVQSAEVIRVCTWEQVVDVLHEIVQQKST